MKWLLSLLLLLKVFSSSSSVVNEFKVEEYYRLPPLFHLDDYQRCLSKPGGLYCLGSFHITPSVQPHPDYDFIKVYSELPYKFNRTIIRRGWCVSERCKPPYQNASQTSPDDYASLRFQHCAANWGRARALTTSLHSLSYCRSHEDTLIKEEPTPAQRIFVEIVYLIIFLNVIGTVYDVMTSNDTKKNSLLTAWSIPANWAQLTTVHEPGDPRKSSLRVLNGAKMVSLLLTIYGHANAIPYMFYTRNPEHLEAVVAGMHGILLANGTSVIHFFIAISAALTTYNLILCSEKNKLSVSLLPLCILKRFIRLTPVYLAIVGFAATWWPYFRQGPMASSVIGAASRLCSNKFWTQALFINNIVDPNNYCLSPSWYLSVDFQLYILTCLLTLIDGWHKRHALVVYPALVAASSVAIGILTYLFDFEPFVTLCGPENGAVMFQNVRSFSYFYTSTWGALPACFIGMATAHIHYEIQKKKFNVENYKWLMMFQNVSILLGICWVLTGSYVYTIDSPITRSVHIALDHTVFVTIIIAGMVIIMNMEMEGGLKKFFGWKGWTPLARLSLPVMLLHWCVNMVIAARPYAYYTSGLDVLVDALGTCLITYAIAVPIAVLLEIPMQKFLNNLIF